ncbi:MAG TPA: SDR family oxidoreductase [Gemmatimonadaceae bacterium]|nr:SDR family oxidoreductase [Gemmatimonadaceae bacterium]
MITLAGKCALVTGGSRGIGAATALLLAESGADVVIGYRHRREDAEHVAAEARAFGVRAAAVASDIAMSEGADALVAAAVQELGALDLFVGNAGIWPVEEEDVTQMSDARWRRTMAQNVDSMFFTTRAAARVLRDHGRIVLVSSTAGQRGEAYHSDYGASKGAMIAFVKSLAPELARRDITVNSVAPGWVDTEMCDIPYADGGRARIAAGIPLGRVADPRDIAGPIVFLCSALARHITGEIVNVNGGSVLCG